LARASDSFITPEVSSQKKKKKTPSSIENALPGTVSRNSLMAHFNPGFVLKTDFLPDPIKP
jgi:hypothetical protein